MDRLENWQNQQNHEADNIVFALDNFSLHNNNKISDQRHRHNLEQFLHNTNHQIMQSNVNSD